MEDIIISVAAKVAEYLVAPIGRQLSYVFSYRSYLDDLKKQVDQLNDAMTSRQRDVGEAKNQGYDIEDDVQKWLIDTKAKIQTAKKFIEDEEAANRSCFNVKSRYQRSREAKKETKGIAELIGQNNFSRVSCQRPPQRIWSTCLRGVETFKSREDTLNQIMEALKSDDIKLIGVWGMGGVGKTTLANQVMKLAEQDKLFDKVVMSSNISQFPNVSKIQGDIADMLGLKFDKDETERVRADRLRTSLKNHKRLLVILDDLWEELRLDQIGIPYGLEGCKVLLTSRKRDLLSKAMGTQKNFEVKQLSEAEASSLFKTNAGDAMENLELRPIALQLAKMCDGLPVAIVTIAKALKGESVAVWKNALDELKRCAPTNIEGVSKEVYSCLELSYKYLKGDEVKHLFLLCSMLGSGDIFMDRLLQYAMCLDLFQQTLSLEQATNKLVTLVKILKDSSLLLDAEDKFYYRSKDQFFFEPDEIKIIRMHDVVRDVARSIASKDPKQFVLKEAGGFEEWQSSDDELINCTHISLRDPNIKRLPERLVCPKLEFLLLVDNNFPRCLKIPDTFFEEMKQLKVLHLHNVDLRELPSSLDALSNLQTLCLTSCYLGDVAIIGALKQLRVLSFKGSVIQRLPEEMTQLNDLRVLDLSRCIGLMVIPRNVISSLFRLEFLFVEENFAKWGAKRFDNDGETNASLSELTNLSNLKTLVINVGKHNLLPEDRVFQNLNRYKIVVGYYLRGVDDIWGSRVLNLNGINSRHDLVNCFSKLLKTTEVLELKNLDDGKQSLCVFNGEDFPKLKHLHIEASAGIQYVVNSMEWAPSRCAFPILESLDLRWLRDLDAIWYGPIPKGSFGHIRKLRLRHCSSLKCVMWLSTSHERELVFPHLKDIELENLPQLMYFCSTETSLIKDSSTTNDAQTPFFDQQVALPSLESLRMNRLGKVATVWQDQVHAGSFRKLKSLAISNCATVRNVYLLRSLETLKIKNCDSLDEIIYVESNEEIHDIAAAPLRELSLKKLPCLKSIRSKDPQECATFKNLRVLKVWDCPLEAHLFAVNVAKGLENLETLHVGGCEVEAIVADENGDAATPLLFPKLTSLRLNRLGKLRCFYRGTSSCALEWPLLKELEVCHCSKVEIVFQGIGSEAEAAISSLRVPPPLFFVQKVALPSLESLRMNRLGKVATVWQGQVHAGSFRKLKSLAISNCATVRNVYLLRSLETLKIKNCDSLDEIIYVESNEEIHDIAAAPLRELSLKKLPCLKSIRSKDPQECATFKNLRVLKVWDCPLEAHLFAVNVAKGLENLETLHVGGCEVEAIVADENGDAATPLLFPKLTSLRLNRLGKLRCFYRGTSSCALEWPLLKELEVCHCSKVEIVFQGIGSEAEAAISSLRVPPPLFFVQKGTFANLEKLTLTCSMKIWQGQFSNESFGKLQHLEVRECNDISDVISSTIIPLLRNVKHLIQKECNSIEDIFQVEEQPCLLYSSGLTSILQNLSSLEVSDCESLMHPVAPSRAKTIMTQLEELTKENCSKGKEIVCTQANSATNVDIVFPKLERVVLRNLPNLRCFGSSRYPLKFPSLREMVDECGAMESFYGTFSSSTELGLMRLPQLTQSCLQISGLYQILHNIKTLEVSDCKNLMYLVTPSMAKSLVQLKELNIYSCNMMTEIVGPEGDDATYDIVFPKLERLRLVRLPKLKSFCPASNYAFNFPSLENFSQFSCNEMEFFCGGALTTPRLVKFNGSKLEGDLNTAIKKRALEKLKISVEEDFEEDNSEEEDFEGGDSREEKEILDTRRSDVEED